MLFRSELIKKTINEDYIKIDDIIVIIKKWKDATLKLSDILFEDAKKEFSENAKVGYGIDGDEECKNNDYKNVRGEFENNPFVNNIIKQKTKDSKKADDIILSLQKL